MDSKDIVSAIVTLIAAFLGAWSAFKLEDRSRRRRQIENNLAAGNRAIFMLLRMFNLLFGIQQQVIEPFRERDARAIIMLPVFPRDYQELKFDVNNLSFLLETKHRQILIELLTEEERFHAAIRALNERSNLHLQEVQPLLEKAGIVEGGEYSKEHIKAALGPRLFTMIHRYTDEAFSHIDKTVDSLLKMSTQLNDVMKILYPNAKFIRFEPDKTAFQKVINEK